MDTAQLGDCRQLKIVSGAYIWINVQYVFLITFKLQYFCDCALLSVGEFKCRNLLGYISVSDQIQKRKLQEQIDYCHFNYV